MKRLAFLSLTIMCVLINLATQVDFAVESAPQGDRIRVMVEYKAGGRSSLEQVLEQADGEIHYKFEKLNTIAVTLPAAALDGIKRNPNVVLVEEDPPRYLTGSPMSILERSLSQSPYEEQVIPYGIDMIQARNVWDINRDGFVDPGAPTGAGKTVCIIDSGFDIAHEDLTGVNIIGGYPTGWNSDGLGHGTHVAGTITALNNEIGVVGVTPGTVNLYIVRVFGDDGSWIYSSTLIDAANRCANAGADIISMSLSGPRASNPERRGFSDLYNAGILSIAAASNEGTTAYHYPASYDSVVSVGALDSTMTWADFSNFNDQVELAAPGVDVLSTVPFIETNTVSIDGVTYVGNHISNTGRGTVNGLLVDGGLCGATNSAWNGRIVLCERGMYSFADKVLNVQTSGGVAALLYNNLPGNILATIEPSSSTIVGLSLSQEDGQYLVANKLGMSALVTSNPPVTGSGYEAWAGTSMATPHVSGAAALVWSCLPTATNVQVRNALTTTALDLGTTGRDVYYGYGLVQAYDACQSLNPTAVDLKSFTAKGQVGAVELQWETTNEINNLGFNLYRAESSDGERIKINQELIPSQTPPGSLDGSIYVFTDNGADLSPGGFSTNQPYYYWLEDVAVDDERTLYGPVHAEVLPQGELEDDEFEIFMPVILF